MKQIKKIIRPLYWLSISICSLSLLQIFSFFTETGNLLPLNSFWLVVLYPFGGIIALIEFLSGFEPIEYEDDWSVILKELKKNDN